MILEKQKILSNGVNKKILIIIGILVFAGLLIGWQYQSQDKSTLRERFQEFKQEFQEKKAQGYDVSEAENLIRQAKQAKQKGDKKKAKRLLKQAFGVLENAQKITELEKTRISAIPETVREEARERLSRVKAASVYQSVTDGGLIGRSVDDVINLLKDTETDFIFRGFWKWVPCADSCSEIPSAAEVYFKKYSCEERGYSYRRLGNAISEIKKEMPNAIFCGAIPAQRINLAEINPRTGNLYTKKEIEAMALDPAKWNITSISKFQLQEVVREEGRIFPI